MFLSCFSLQWGPCSPQALPASLLVFAKMVLGTVGCLLIKDYFQPMQQNHGRSVLEGKEWLILEKSHRDVHRKLVPGAKMALSVHTCIRDEA